MFKTLGTHISFQGIPSPTPQKKFFINQSFPRLWHPINYIIDQIRMAGKINSKHTAATMVKHSTATCQKLKPLNTQSLERQEFFLLSLLGNWGKEVSYFLELSWRASISTMTASQSVGSREHATHHQTEICLHLPHISGSAFLLLEVSIFGSTTLSSIRMKDSSKIALLCVHKYFPTSEC